MLINDTMKTMHATNDLEKMSCKIGEQTYDIFFANFEVKDGDIEASDIKILVNGEPKSTFGETFSFHEITPFDILENAVLSYINNDASVVFVEVPDKIKELKNELFNPFMTVDNREVPEKFYYHIGTPLSCRMVADTGVAYADNDYFVLTNKDGHVETTIEAFYTSGAVQMFVEDTILFIDKTERDHLEEILEEENTKDE